MRPGVTTGDIAPSSVFEDERRVDQQISQEAAVLEQKQSARDMKGGIAGRDPTSMRRTLDPNPGARERFERKKVIQMVRKGGRLTKVEFLKRTEREHLVRSHNMKTSVKKLGMLARQIAGKSVEDAIVQMRFSKKKAAVEVRKQLEFARDEAVVMRGMGLGIVELEGDTAAAEAANASRGERLAIDDVDLNADRATAAALADKKNSEKPVEIQLKDGKRHTVTDPSNIYIDQAWVGRGPYGRLPDYRARGRVNIMRTPWTSISLLLKEESTRIREHQEREAKRKRQKLDNVWVHLPDRPIQTKSQWYSW